jgi:hypothetical protein
MAMPDQITFQAPLDGAFRPVVRLIVGGIAERANFGFEAMDDLQLAIERLLVEAGSDGQVELSFELREDGIRTNVGPLHEKGLAEALQAPDSRPGSLSLGRILSTVVDSYGVQEVSGGDIVVRLEKLGGGVR